MVSEETPPSDDRLVLAYFEKGYAWRAPSGWELASFRGYYWWVKGVGTQLDIKVRPVIWREMPMDPVTSDRT